MIVKNFALILGGLTLFTRSAVTQDSIGCFVDGECLDALLVAATVLGSPSECLEFCRGKPECQYYTHYESQQSCFAFHNCSEVSDDDCDDCVSGDVECENLTCDVSGKRAEIMMTGGMPRSLCPALIAHISYINQYKK